MTGGRWLDKARQQWVCTGKQVLEHLHTNTLDAKLLGVPHEKTYCAGAMVLPPVPKLDGRKQERPPPRLWTELDITRQLLDTPKAGVWHAAESVSTVHGDVAYVGSEVIICSEKVWPELHVFVYFKA